MSYAGPRPKNPMGPRPKGVPRKSKAREAADAESVREMRQRRRQ